MGPTGRDAALPQPREWTTERCAEALEALANPRRLELLRLLTEPMYLREIASELGISRQATHHHLDTLVEAGLLARQSGSRESGRVTEYVPVPSGLSSVHELAERLAGTADGHRDRLDRAFQGEGVPDVADPPDGPALWVVAGLDRGAALDFPVSGDVDGSWFVGRAPTADLVLEGDPFVSPEHAEVWSDGSDLLLRDLASENGTYVDGELLGRREEAVLAHGDVVGVGRSLLAFRDG